jgi:hypothetical protein
MATPDRPDEQASRNPRSADASGTHGASSPDERLDTHLFDLSPFPGVVSRLADNTALKINARTSEMFGIPQDQVRGLKVTESTARCSRKTD